LLRTAGIFVTEAGMRIARSLRVEGDFASTGSADIDGTLNVDAEMTVGGDAVFSGAMRIEGTLSLPAGIIDNDALASPVVLRSEWSDAGGFATPNSTWLELCSVSVVVPDGFTDIQFSAMGSVLATNSTAGTHYLFVRVARRVNGGPQFTGIQAQAVVPSLYTATGIAPYNWNEPVTPGDTHRFALQVWTSAAFAADGNHYGRLDVPIIFTR